MGEDDESDDERDGNVYERQGYILQVKYGWKKKGKGPKKVWGKGSKFFSDSFLTPWVMHMACFDKFILASMIEFLYFVDG